ncbi:uncharacterized protein M421DRAFT_788 [Didymella exigua CBS 183.55]|uniref:Uncharacterized protein n=1 Tax=Didymella exigua CBS 183.55 TaxID=1150837 RepID=A0A6A5S0I6_9PLEO|nr:uncharacterized protein M421DRAFT_788 [Didymella exigua CBS 183.55]KAF1933373.1 hypothetical protein M421DRAFT_788 [Didymella exigua CBS 183.55]
MKQQEDSITVPVTTPATLAHTGNNTEHLSKLQDEYDVQSSRLNEALATINKLKADFESFIGLNRQQQIVAATIPAIQSKLQQITTKLSGLDTSGKLDSAIRDILDHGRWLKRDEDELEKHNRWFRQDNKSVRRLEGRVFECEHLLDIEAPQYSNIEEDNAANGETNSTGEIVSLDDTATSEDFRAPSSPPAEVAQYFAVGIRLRIHLARASSQSSSESLQALFPPRRTSPTPSELLPSLSSLESSASAKDPDAQEIEFDSYATSMVLGYLAEAKVRSESDEEAGTQGRSDVDGDGESDDDAYGPIGSADSVVL